MNYRNAQCLPAIFIFYSNLMLALSGPIDEQTRNKSASISPAIVGHWVHQNWVFRTLCHTIQSYMIDVLKVQMLETDTKPAAVKEESRESRTVPSAKQDQVGHGHRANAARARCTHPVPSSILTRRAMRARRQRPVTFGGIP